MNDSLKIESLADLFPGKSTLEDATLRWGTALVSPSSDGSLFYTFSEQGIRLHAVSESDDDQQAVIDEVAIIPPYAGTLPCGVALGDSKLAALQAIRQSYQVTDEFEDAIYFRPSGNSQLLAAVEFMKEEVVLLIELLHYSPHELQD
jgi:hypothetical protein